MKVNKSRIKLRYLIIGSVGFMIGWNVFLIQRDSNPIRHYDHPKLEELK
jgi:hypothetical protein